MIHDLQSEVSGDYSKALLILAEVLITLFTRHLFKNSKVFGQTKQKQDIQEQDQIRET